MAKAHLKFDLSNVEDRQEYLRCVRSLDMALVLWEFLRNSRKKIEHKLENSCKATDAFDGVEACFERFRELIEEHGIIVDDLID